MSDRRADLKAGFDANEAGHPDVSISLNLSDRVVDIVNEVTGKDYRWFFDVYLYSAALPELVERATSWDLSTLPAGAATGAPIAEVRALLVRRDLPFPVLEVFVATEFGRYVWETLSGIVSSLGGAPAGWQALRAEGWR